MSEYQYYEFQALDRPLTESEQAYIRSLSRRVSLTPTQAIFTYQYGNFPGDPKKILRMYFDAMLYIANWGTRQLMFRLPRSVTDVSELDRYCFPRIITTSVTKDSVILDICFHEEKGGHWVEGEGQLSALRMLRNDILRGDFRVLYLAWLKTAQLEGARGSGEKQLEPPVPADLQNLSDPLKAFVELFEIDNDLISVASEASLPRNDDSEQFGKWVAALPEHERNQFLVRVARGEAHVDVQLLKRLREISLNNQKMHAPSAPHQRTLSGLLTAGRERTRYREEQQRQEAEQARIRKLNALAKKEKVVWERVYALIETKQPKAYDEAVICLVELHRLAQHIGQLDRFQTQINKIHQGYRNRPGLLSRLQQAGLGKDRL